VAIAFHTQDSNFSLKQKTKHRQWISSCLEAKGFKAGELSLIFTSNTYLLSINREYLNHNYFTDVITFDYSEHEILVGDIFISVDQVKLNADDYTVSFEEELRRVMIHGVLHLMGLNDATDIEKEEMRAGENAALVLWESGIK